VSRSFQSTGRLARVSYSISGAAGRSYPIERMFVRSAGSAVVSGVVTIARSTRPPCSLISREASVLSYR